MKLEETRLDIFKNKVLGKLMTVPGFSRSLDNLSKPASFRSLLKSKDKHKPEDRTKSKRKPQKKKAIPGPNISLNFQDPRLYSSATYEGLLPIAKLCGASALGMIFQGGVLVYFWILTFNPTLSGGHVSATDKVGLGLSFFGIVFMITGLFTCAFVIQESTKEQQWHVQSNQNLKSNEKFQLLWVQKPW
jgi:hypothetical protein